MTVANGGTPERDPRIEHAMSDKCEVCAREWMPEDWSLDRDGEYDAFCSRELFASDVVPPAAECYRLGYERLRAKLEQAEQYAARMDLAHDMAASQALPVGHVWMVPPVPILLHYDGCNFSPCTCDWIAKKRTEGAP